MELLLHIRRSISPASLLHIPPLSGTITLSGLRISSHLYMSPLLRFLSHLNMELILHICGSISPASLLHLNLLLFIFFSYSLTWNPAFPRISHLYLARILSLSFHLYMTLFRCFSADITTPLPVALLLHLSPPLSGTFSSHLKLAPAPRRGFFTPTFTCNPYSPSASILFHLNVTLPQGFSAEYFYPP